MSARKSPSGSLRWGVPVILILSFAFAGAALCRAQEQTQQSQAQDQKLSVAEAAREERSRKQSHEKKARHVYTAEDLKREHILTPQDRAELEARKNQPPTAPVGPQKLPEGVGGRTVAEGSHAARPAANSAEVPLGDIARRVRREKESQQLERSAEFPLPFADATVLASPKPPAQPLLPSVAVAPPTVVVPSPRVVAPWRPFVRRSPFERPRVLPPPPVTPRRLAPSRRAPSPTPRTPRVPVPAPQPPASTAASPPISAELTIVTVKAGDSLWKFAAARLGDGQRWQELVTLNPGLGNPELLEVGTPIVLPASFAPPQAPAKYAVRRGETLWTIAQTQLGHGTAWSCIAHANPDLGDANLIHEGQVLLLPASCLP